MTFNVPITVRQSRLWLARLWVWGMLRAGAYLVGPNRAHRWAHAGVTRLRIVRIGSRPRRKSLPTRIVRLCATLRRRLRMPGGRP